VRKWRYSSALEVRHKHHLSKLMIAGNSTCISNESLHHFTALQVCMDTQMYTSVMSVLDFR